MTADCASWPRRLSVGGVRIWPLQDIRLVRGLCPRISTIMRYYEQLLLLFAPPPPPASPTRLRNIVFPPDHPVLQYMTYNIGNGNIM